jgi:tripartite-type tricarboxylate transporter receptor subunit TctC
LPSVVTFGVTGEPVGTTPAEFAAIVRNDHAKWGEVIRNANIKLE